MGVEFVLLGVYLIWYLFYIKQENKNYLLVFSLFLLLLSYFVKDVVIGCVVINIWVVLGMIGIVVYVIIEGVGFKKSISSGIIIASVYTLINFIDIDCNLFFSLKEVVLIIICINFLNLLSAREWILSTMLGLIMVEIFNMFFILPKLQFMTLFDENVILCIVVCIGFKLLTDEVFKTLKRTRYEKNN